MVCSILRTPRRGRKMSGGPVAKNLFAVICDQDDDQLPERVREAYESAYAATAFCSSRPIP